MKAPKESDLYQPILQYLGLRGIQAWRCNSGAFGGEHKGKRWFVKFGAPGMSDILGILPGGRFLAIEVKRPGCKLTKAQAEFLDRVDRAGGLGFAATSIADVERALTLEGVI